MPLGRLLRRGSSRTFVRSSASLGASQDEPDFYNGVVIGADTIGARALEPEVLESVQAVLRTLEQDAYLAYVDRFVQAGRRVASNEWRYADITTALAAATSLLEPRSYLEIGVRTGRSAAVVATGAPECALVGIDLWNVGYAGMENPGPDHVRSQLERLGHTGPLRFVSGDSHHELPKLFAAEPELSFDLITVDGDHSEGGARQDLGDVLPRLRVGGALIFDDISHPSHPYLAEVWRSIVASDRRYATWEYDDVGFGVAVAVRRW
jgi:predicted O-methyltransferase YrrM